MIAVAATHFPMAGFQNADVKLMTNMTPTEHGKLAATYTADQWAEFLNEVGAKVDAAEFSHLLDDMTTLREDCVLQDAGRKVMDEFGTFWNAHMRTEQ